MSDLSQEQFIQLQTQPVTYHTRFSVGSVTYVVDKIYSDKKIKVRPFGLTMAKKDFPTISQDLSNDSTYKSKILLWQDAKRGQVCGGWFSGSDAFYISE